MNLPQGYKQTELGIIPEDWDVRKICDGIADVKSGKRLPYGYYVTENRTNHPYIRVIDMRDGGIDTSNLMYVPNEAYKPIEKYRIFKDDIFISVAGTLGIVGKIPEWLDGANLTENANRLTGITCNRDYLLYYLRSPYIQDVISSEQTIGAQPKLALTRIRNFDIALPSNISEQKAIAEALSDVDELITALDKKIAKKRLIKQGAMQELLTGKKRLPGFTEEWVEVALGEILSYEQPTKYLVSSTEYCQSGIPVLTAGKTFILGYTTETTGIYTDVPVIIFDDFTTDSKYVTTPFKAKSSAMKMLQLKDKRYNLRLIYDLMQLIQFPLYDHQRYWISEFSKINVNIPSSFEEQQAIAKILSDMDKEIADLEAQRDKYRLVKSGMMQKLLTGQIRLKKE